MAKVAEAGVDHAHNEKGCASVDGVHDDFFGSGHERQKRRQEDQEAEHEAKAGNKQGEGRNKHVADFSDAIAARASGAVDDLGSAVDTESKADETDETNDAESIRRNLFYCTVTIISWLAKSGEQSSGFYVHSLQKTNGGKSERRNTQQVADKLGSDDVDVLGVVNQEKLADGACNTQRSEDDEESPARRDGLEALAEAEEKGQNQAWEKGDKLQNGNAISVSECRHCEASFVCFFKFGVRRVIRCGEESMGRKLLAMSTFAGGVQKSIQKDERRRKKKDAGQVKKISLISAMTSSANATQQQVVLSLL